jgi:8-oxo-dGTP pyrophosphatase MutT (NUDIX family)
MSQARSQILQHLQQAANNPEFHWDWKNDRRLNYQKLRPHVGVCCYVHCDEHVLLLERSKQVNGPGYWGTVSGFVDKLSLLQNLDISSDISLAMSAGTEIFAAHLREEFHEELGWSIDAAHHLQHHQHQTLEFPDLQVHLELFSLALTDRNRPIVLNAEHTSYQWVPFVELEQWRSRLLAAFIEGMELCGLAI